MSGFAEISSGASCARIALRGAELKSWRADGRELIWPGDISHWPDSAPILFPVVGWTRNGVVVDGKRYPLGLHGFARTEHFALAKRTDKSAVLRLTANERTRELYPFEFQLDIEYIINNNELSIILGVTNKDDALPLPFACGLHPGFVWPLPGAHGPHIVRFDAPEQGEVPVIAPGGFFSAERRTIPLEGRELKLTPTLFAEALCFLDARSEGLEFASADGAACLRMEVENFPHLALWSRPNAPFLCLEAWTGHGDPVDFAGDLFAKPSMRLLAPGEIARSAARFIWRP
jgi:galactose mutarotase-like enzyme